MKSLIKYGWATPGVVSVDKRWCEVCFLNRWHEKFDGRIVCLACCNVLEAEIILMEGEGMQIIQTGQEVEWRG
jgi:hypothetical protein